MKKLFVLFCLLSFASFALAEDPRIIDFNVSPAYYGVATDINVSIDANGTIGRINFWDNNVIVEQKTYSASDSTIKFSKIWSVLGNRTIGFSVSDSLPADSNSENNTKYRTIEVKKGIDFKVVSITASPETYIPNTHLNLQIVIQNIGDTDFNGTTELALLYDANFIHSTSFSNLAVNETKVIDDNFTLPADFVGSHQLISQVNYISGVKEFDYTNNSISKALAESGIANIIIDSFSYDGNILKGKGTTFTLGIKNDGGTAVTNVLVKVYRSAIGENTLVQSFTIAGLNGHATQLLNFTYYFTKSGDERFIAYADPYNTINELSDNDNTSEISFFIVDSNVDIDLTTFLANLELIEGELTSCKEDRLMNQLEKETCFNSLSSMTQERDSCNGNLNTCNSNNATFLSNWKDGFDTNVAALESYYFSQLEANTRNCEANMDGLSGKIKAEQENTNLVSAICVAIILFFGGLKVMELRSKRATRMVK